MSNAPAMYRDLMVADTLGPSIKPGSKRWVLVNRRTGKGSRSFSTRDAARVNKSSIHRIFDTNSQTYVR